MGELWQQAVAWLKSTGVVPPESPCLSPSARVYDLALALQDGTVLCNCLNKIHANSVRLVNERPAKQFLKLQNINSFIAAAQTQFGLKQNDLFSADELYYASDFPKVVSCLSLLSKTSLATAAGYKPFPQSGGPTRDKARDEDGEDMYQRLEDLVGQSISFEGAASDMTHFDDDAADDDVEIYGNIQKIIDSNKAIIDSTPSLDAHSAEDEDVYQDLVMGSRSEDIYGSGLNTPDEKRSNVLAELADTERNYVKVLHTIVDAFQVPLSKHLSKLDCKVIFSNIHEILDAHTVFLTSLEQQMKSQTGRMISESFIPAMKSFRCYGLFCCEIPDAMEKLKELQSKPATAKMLDQAKKDSGQRFPLKDLLNVPMQRILKYPLLLKEVIKHTPDTHKDKQSLQQSLVSVQELAKYINETKKDYDNLKNMIASLKNYSGRPLQEYGTLQRDNDLLTRSEAAKEKFKDRYVFLFQTAVVECKLKGVVYNFKNTTELTADHEVVDIPFWSLPKEEQNGKYTFAWALKKKGGNAEQNLVFAAKAAAIKKKWMTSMQNNIEAIRDKQTGPPEVAPRGPGSSDAPAPAVAPRPPANPSPSPSPSPSKKEQPPAVPPGKPGSYESWVVGAPPGKKEEAKRPTTSYEPWVIGSGPPPTPAPLPSAPATASNFDNSVWFAGKMARGKAEKILSELPDGSFLVRESDSRPGDYSLSIQYKIVKHIKINRHGKMYDLAPDAKPFPTIEELIEHFMVHSLNRHFPGMETTLAFPFKTVANKSSTTKKSAPVGIGRCRSRFAYTAKSNDELTFDRGVEIVIISTHDQDPGWWRGQLPTGEQGVFPANYVQQL